MNDGDSQFPFTCAIHNVPSFSSSKSHIFDGVTLTKETAAFQLCDIHDPMLKDMIESEEDLRETCDVGTPVALTTPSSHTL